MPVVLPLSGLRGIAYRSGYSLKALRSSAKTPSLVRVRWRMYAEAYASGYSLPQIGRFFHKDHTTVLYGIRRHLGMAAHGQYDPGGNIPDISTLLVKQPNPESLASLDAELRGEALFCWSQLRMDTEQIADRLCVSEATVYNFLSTERERMRHEQRLAG